MSAPAKLPRITLASGRERSVERRHPWIFSGAIASREDSGEEGEIVSVCDSRGRQVGCGYTSAEGSISVKMISFGATPFSSEVWAESVERAFALRQRLGLFDNSELTACRVVNAEGDALPGLICDRYNDTYVVQFQSAGISRARETIVEAIRSTAPAAPAGIYLKEHRAPKDREEDGGSAYLFGSAGDSIILENGVRFGVDWERGQKTGFFLDQRENRALLRRLSRGARVLNAFCYTGGFSLNALVGGAASVVSVDTSATALEQLEKNLELNSFPGAHESVKDDVLTFIERDDRPFDVIVLDPPAFVKHRGALKGGLQGYRKINRRGFARIERGGLLFTFSCSQAVTPEIFRDEVFAAAAEAGRPVRILAQLHQAPCHPISLFHPEGEYLKGLVLEVG